MIIKLGRLTSTDGNIKERLEVSFYSDELKTFETYIKMIRKIIPENKSILSKNYYNLKSLVLLSKYPRINRFCVLIRTKAWQSHIDRLN